MPRILTTGPPIRPERAADQPVGDTLATPAEESRPTRSKAVPYLPRSKDRSGANLNGSARIGGKPVMCRHLATSYLKAAREGRTHTLLAAFSTRLGIEQQLTAEGGVDAVNADFMARSYLAHDSAKHLVSADRLGEYLGAVADTLGAGALNGSASTTVMLLTERHALAAKVSRKAGGGPPRVTVSVYDPNLTATHVRMEAADSFGLAGLRLADINTALALTQDGPTRLQLVAIAQGVAVPSPQRQFAGPLDTHALNMALSHGLVSTLNDVAQQLAARAPAEDKAALLARLAARDSRGQPALGVAMARNIPQAVLSYARVLASARESGALQHADVCTLIAGRTARGETPLSGALLVGAPAAVQAYGEALCRAGLTRAERAEVLRNAASAFASIHPAPAPSQRAALSELGALTQALGLSAAAAARILACNDEVGTPLLHHLLAAGDAQAVNALGEVHAALGQAPDVVAELLLARDSLGVPGLHAVLGSGRADCIDAYAALLELHAEHLGPQRLGLLLGAGDLLGQSPARAAMARPAALLALLTLQRRLAPLAVPPASAERNRV